MIVWPFTARCPGGRTRKGWIVALADSAVELRDGSPVRLRIKLVPDDGAGSLVGFVTEVTEPGSTIITDGSSARRPNMPPANRDASSMSAMVTLLGGSAGATERGTRDD